MIFDTIISGSNIYLKCINHNNCTTEYVEWLNDIQINQFLESRWFKQDINSVKEFIELQRNSKNNYMFAIYTIDDNKYIGNIKIGSIDYNNSLGDVGYIIGDKEYWGKGYATEAVRLVTKYAFDELKLNRLEAGVIEGNISSEKVLLNTGYIIEGIRRKRSKFDNNQYRDVILFGKVREI